MDSVEIRKTVKSKSKLALESIRVMMPTTADDVNVLGDIINPDSQRTGSRLMRAHRNGDIFFFFFLLTFSSFTFPFYFYVGLL